MKKIFNFKVILQCILFALLSCACSSLVHAFNSAFIEGVHGKPEFVTNSIFMYSFYEKLSYAIVYVCIGRFIPIKNKVLRGFTYIMLIWASDFMPQLFGLAFADGPIAEAAFSASIAVCDSLVFLITGLLFGILVNVPSEVEYKKCSKSSILKTSLISMVSFPLLVIAGDMILKSIDESFGSRGAIGVSQQQAIPFYLCFYGCFLITGILLPIFYRITLYNTEKAKSAFWFGLYYSIGIWTPVVLIMIVFGTELIPTLVYTILFIAVLLVVTTLNGILLNHFEKTKKEKHNE